MIKPYSTHFFQLTTKPCFDTFFNRLQNKILNPDAEGWGEICSRGRNIFMGYHHDEDATRKAFSEDGEYWYKSGDIGRIDEDGFMLLRGRIKELIVTAGGENIAPVPIEERIKRELQSVVSNVVLIGEAKKYLTVLLTVRVDVDADTLLPTDRLEPSATFWCKKRGANNVRTINDFINGPHAEKLRAGIQEGLDRANAEAYSRPQRVQKFSFVPEEFSVKGDELGPTLKVKRHVVHKKYEDLINTMY
jgi:long-chain-fatty-acid--CoA ligase ACSBG